MRHFDLKKSEFDANLYLNDDICLVITGQGVHQCKLTLQRIFTTYPELCSGVWLNFGIAGIDLTTSHAQFNSHAAGDMIWIDCICYRQESWDLQFPLPDGLGEMVFYGGILRTVDLPETAFSQPMVYDMECAGIVEFLLQYDQLFRLTVVKLISDGPDLSGREAIHLGKHLLLKQQDQIALVGERLLRISKAVA